MVPESVTGQPPATADQAAQQSTRMQPSPRIAAGGPAGDHPGPGQEPCLARLKGPKKAMNR